MDVQDCNAPVSVSAPSSTDVDPDAAPVATYAPRKSSPVRRVQVIAVGTCEAAELALGADVAATARVGDAALVGVGSVETVGTVGTGEEGAAEQAVRSSASVPMDSDRIMFVCQREVPSSV